MSHTPGPWRYAGRSVAGAFHIGPEEGYSVGIIHHSPDGEANARLVAAAPDLLAALEECQAEIHIECGLTDYPSCIRARAAIAKAKGEA